MRPAIIRRMLATLLTLAVTATAGYFFFHGRSAQATGDVPFVPVRKGEFLVMVRCRGELNVQRSVQVIAPTNVPDLRIAWQVPDGSMVEAGQEVLKYDTSSARQQLQQRQVTLSQSQATLDQASAQARTTAEQDKRDLLQVRYEVERARLEVSKAEIVSALQAEESRVNLELAQRKLSVQEATGALHEASAVSKIAALTRNRDQAKAEVDLANERIGRMVTTTPVPGMIVFRPNYAQGWANAKPFKVGDQLYPGMNVAEIPALETLELEGKIEEIDRGRVAEGMDVRVKIDSLAELSLPAKLDRISPLTQLSYEFPMTSSFRGYARLGKVNARLRPGMNGSMDVIVRRIPNAASVPAKAIFTRNGRPIVYVQREGRFLPYEVKIVARNPDEVAVEGVSAGSNVATIEPGMPGAGTQAKEGKNI